MALSADTPRVTELGELNTLPMAASTTIYEGSAVGDNGSGYARALVAGDPFRGFAEKHAVNATAVAGAANVKVITRGKIKLAVGSLAITDVGKPVFASADGTFTLTMGANSRIGTVHRYVSSGVGIVDIDTSRADGTYRIVTAGEATTAGGAAAEAITVTGVLATDIVLVTLLAVGSTPRTILTSIASANTITVTFSGDPAADHVVSYVVLRAL